MAKARRHKQRFQLLITLAASAAGCATTTAGKTDVAGPPVQVAGIWEGFAQDKIADGVGAGDTKIERQAWHLRQSGGAVSGFYVVELTMISGDGRPYACSREPRFSTLMRFEVKGHATSKGIEIDEVGDTLAKGPCRPSFRSPSHYLADLRGDTMSLQDGDRRLTLYRKAAKEPGPAQQLLAFERPDRTWTGEPAFPTLDRASVTEGPSGGSPPLDLQGVWVWEHRGRVASGDEKQEREEWHLDQEGTRLSGYYDRSVRQVSTDGQAYRCSNATEFQVTTRYHLAGEVSGNRVVLYERSFEILESSPCDSGQRRLDAYQGEAALDEVKLLWGVGTQVLRRDRAGIPSQRF